MKAAILSTCLLAAVGCARTCGSTYPPTFPILSNGEKANRVERVRKRFPGTYSAIDLTPTGFVAKIETSDPALSPADPANAYRMSAADVARWSHFVGANADLFGVGDASQLTWDLPDDGPPQLPEMVFCQRVDGVEIGAIEVFKHPDAPTKSRVEILGHVWPLGKLPPASEPSAELIRTLKAPFVGKPYEMIPRPPPAGAPNPYPPGPWIIRADDMIVEGKLAITAGPEGLQARRVVTVWLRKELGAVTGEVVSLKDPMGDPRDTFHGCGYEMQANWVRGVRGSAPAHPGDRSGRRPARPDAVPLPARSRSPSLYS